MSKAPAFQLYAADFYVDTVGWTATEVGAYLRLLLHEWVEGPLESKISVLARIAGVDQRNMQKMWSTAIAKKFTTDDAGMYINLRLEETRQSQLNYIESQKESGKRGAEKRWKKDSDPISNPNGEKIALQSSSSSSSSSSKKKDKTLKTFLSDSVEIGLVEYFFSLIKENYPKAKEPNKQTWARDIDLMMRIDNRTPDDIRKVMEWCQHDSFWLKNVLSVEKLRKQYDQLYLKMGGSNGSGTNGRGSTGKVTQGPQRAGNLGDGAAYPVDCEETIT